MKNKITIIPSDDMVIVDGVAQKMDLDQYDLDPDIHAIQWNGKDGRIEYKVRENEFLTKLPAAFKGIINDHRKLVKAIEAEENEIAQKMASAPVRPPVSESVEIEFKQRQKAKMLVAKARKARADGDMDAAFYFLAEAVEPVEDADSHDAQILAAIKREKK